MFCQPPRTLPTSLSLRKRAASLCPSRGTWAEGNESLKATNTDLKEASSKGVRDSQALRKACKCLVEGSLLSSVDKSYSSERILKGLGDSPRGHRRNRAKEMQDLPAPGGLSHSGDSRPEGRKNRSADGFSQEKHAASPSSEAPKPDTVSDCIHKVSASQDKKDMALPESRFYLLL